MLRRHHVGGHINAVLAGPTGAAAVDDVSFGEMLETFQTSHAGRVGHALNVDVLASHAPQSPAPLWSQFVLVRTGHDYRMVRRTTGVSYIAHGQYAFVVTVDQPCEVICAQVRFNRKEAVYRHVKRYASVDGHASLAWHQPVIFAGQALFTCGKLMRWNNLSGHYKPDNAQRYYLPGYVRRLLPEDLYVGYRQR
ncbi:hypothetical protein SHA53_003104 [Salmonella enterica]|nr:hypothetical protein [Salmonella enterica]